MMTMSMTLRKRHFFYVALYFLMLIGFTTTSFKTNAQKKIGKPVRIVFLVDASSSMLEDWQAPINRFKEAGILISAIADSIAHINPDAEFAVRVFGHQHPAEEKNCFDTRLEVGFNKRNGDQIRRRMAALNPIGWSPIALSLKETALEEFDEDSRYAYSIILVTDGGESCNGDICATMQELLAKKISFQPYILSLIDYAPLKQQYECLGNYLTVSKESEVVPAIQKIIEDNRPIITQTALPTPLVIKPVEKVVEPVAPPIKPAEVPPAPKAPNATTIATIDKYLNSKFSIPQPKLIAAKLNIPTLPKINIAPEEIPIIPTPPPVSLPKAIGLSILPTRKIAPLKKPNVIIKVQPMLVKALPKVKVEEEYIAPPPPKAKAMAPLGNLARQTRFNILFSLATAQKIRINHLPVIRGLIEASPVAPTNPQTRQIPSPNVSPNTPPAKVVVEDAASTSISVYFTNGKGKYYSTEPDMIIKDSKTGKEVKHQLRTVDFKGNPESIDINSGTYDILFPGSVNRALNVNVTANKNNKIEVVVTTGTLSFQYANNPNRPVKEYVALVSKRFEDRSVTSQKCDEIKAYEPANYHVEVNTLPPSLYNIDLVFGALSPITLPEPGTIQIDNTDNIGRVEYWRELGDQFVRFYEMSIYGDTENQKADFKPGSYEIRYVKPTGGPVRKVTIVKFQIQSNKTTHIKLEP